MVLQLWPTLTLDLEEAADVARRIAPATVGLGLEEVHVLCQRPDRTTGATRPRAVKVASAVADRHRVRAARSTGRPAC